MKDKGITLQEHLAMHNAADDNHAEPANKARDPQAKKQKAMVMELTLESILDFGKHAGKQVEDMIYDQAGYMKWLVEKTDKKISGEVIALMKQEGII